MTLGPDSGPHPVVVDRVAVDPPSRTVDADYVGFFSEMLPSVMRTATRIVGDRATAEDVAAEALARAYLRWPQLRSADHRGAWVMRVASNEALGVVRKRARRSRILRQRWAEPEGVEVVGEPVAAHHTIVHEVRTLPRRQREVVALRFFADLTTEETAQALRISTGSVKTHLHRALATLRDRLPHDLQEGFDAPE